MIARFTEESPYPGVELVYQDGRFSTATGVAIAVPELVRLDRSGAIAWTADSTRDWFYDNQENFGAPVQQANVPTATATVIDADYRSQLLAQAIQTQVASGARVESQGPFNAVVVRGKRVNHLLHLILSLLTAGLWLFVWLILAAAGGEKRSTINVDPYGNVLVQRV